MAPTVKDLLTVARASVSNSQAAMDAGRAVAAQIAATRTGAAVPTAPAASAVAGAYGGTP